MGVKFLESMPSRSRRDFLRIAAAGLAVGASAGGTAPGTARESARPLEIVIFSKHLQFLEWDALARTAAEIGFDGIDLTVRAGGHVLPERVENDLPKAVEVIRKANLTVPMVTAGIVDATTPHAEAMIKTIGGLGVRRYRWGGFQWRESKSIPDRLAELKRDAARLAEMNSRYGVCAMYHTHSGMEVGASIWDLWLLLEDLDRKSLGINYDLAHATIEGGLGGYIASFRLVAPLIKGIAVKDFRWRRSPRGEWGVEWCPLGEGMVNFKRFFSMMREASFSGPLQLHFEYPLGGAEDGSRTITIDRERVFAAMKKDLTLLRGWLREAGLA